MRAAMAEIDDRRPLAVGGEQEVGHRLDRPLRGREPDAQRRRAGEVRQTLERDRQVRAALVVDHGVDLVHDHGLDRAQHLAPAVRGEQDVERLRRRHQDVRRTLEHRGARRGRRVAGAHRGPDRDLGLAALAQPLEDAGERLLEVALDVVRERLERRDVDDPGALGKVAAGGDALAHQVVDHRQERGQRLAGAGGGRDQGGPPLLDRGPGLELRRRGLAESLLEPGGDGGMEEVARQMRSVGAAIDDRTWPGGCHGSSILRPSTALFTPDRDQAYCQFPTVAAVSVRPIVQRGFAPRALSARVARTVHLTRNLGRRPAIGWIVSVLNFGSTRPSACFATRDRATARGSEAP